ncbi:MAG TPA: hypothetical protein VGK90_08580, partial [Rhizomicrobium sp.]
VIPRCAFAQKFETTRLPLPINIDGRQVSCPLYLKLEMKTYNIPFDKFSAGNKAEAMFATAVQAIRSRDTAKFASVWTSPDQMKRLSGETTTVSLTDNSTANWINTARSMFQFDHLTVVAEILVGPDTMFVWEAPTESVPRRAAFYVGFDQKNQTRLSIASSNAPVLSLIKSAFDAAQTTDGHAYPPVPKILPSYPFAIAIAGSDKPETHPAYLEFNGTPIDFPVGNLKVTSHNLMLAFMRKAVRDLHSGRNDAFAHDFTPRSGERVKQWLDAIALRNRSMKTPAANMGMNAATAGMQAALESNVKFVLDADPVYLVFQAAGPGNNWTPEGLSYSYVIHEGDTYKIANFSASDDLDDVLQNPALFDKNSLKTAPHAQAPAQTIPHLR